MSKINKECIDEAAKVLNKFSREEVREYLTKVFNKAREYDKLRSRASIEKAVQEINKEELQSLMEDVLVTQQNALKHKLAKGLIDEKKATLRELTTRDRSGRNQAFNIESSQANVYSELSRTFHEVLNTDEMNFLLDRKNNMDIARAIDGKQASPTAKKIADAHKQLVDKSNAKMVESGAMTMSEINKDRQISSTHDKSKMLSPGVSLGRAALSKAKYTVEKAKGMWIDFISKRLDIEKTFKDTEVFDLDGNIDMEKVREILAANFDNIVSGKSDIITKSVVVNDQQAIKRRQKMFFYWKDTENWMQYNERYGKGDYYRGVLSHIQGTANKAGTAEIFGYNPTSAYASLRKAYQKVNPEYTELQSFHTDLLFNHITGADKTTKSPALSTFFSNIRAVAGAARLGSIGLLSLPDIAGAAAFASKFGVNYWKSYLYHFQHLFNSFNDEERKYIAKLFAVNCKSHLGYVGKFIDANDTSEVVNKVMNNYYRINLLQSLDEGNKVSMMHVMARHLSEMSKHEFHELPESLRLQLEKFNFSKEEWNILRKKNKMNLFTTDNVDALTNEEIQSIHTARGQDIPLHQVKNELHRKVFALFDVASEAAIGQPSEFLKAFMNFGTKSGTIGGELLRSVMQFKAFPIQWIDRMLIRGFADKSNNRLMYGLNLFAATLPLSVGANFFNYIAQGKTFPDITQMTAPELLRFTLENIQPNIGMFYKALDPKRENHSMFLDFFRSPTTDLLGNMLSTVSAAGLGAVTLDKDLLEEAAKGARRTAEGMFPFTTIPFLSPYYREMMNEESYLQPGQTQWYGS